LANTESLSKKLCPG